MSNVIPTVYTPILSTVVQQTTNKSEMVASMLQFLLLNPGRTSAYVEGDLISFRKMAGAQGHDRGGMVRIMEQYIPSAINRLFPNHTVNVTFSTSNYNDDPDEIRFEVTMDILLIDNFSGSSEPVLLKGSFIVNSDDSISVSFNNN